MRVSNHIKSAVGKLSQHKQLSHDELTTIDFGQIVPVCVVPLLPRDKFNISASCFSRVSPMIFPTYGDCKVVTNFHSVQYNKVWKDFDIFVSGQFYNGTTALRFPCVTFKSLLEFFYLPNSESSSSIIYAGNADETNNDLIIARENGVKNFYFLTVYGRYLRKILSSLGYPFITYVDEGIIKDDPSKSSMNVLFSALPLVSLIKIYSDFYESRQYSATSFIREILRECYIGVSGSHWSYVNNSIYSVSCMTINQSSLKSFFDNFKLLYPSDYFTSAQQLPNIVGGNTTLSTNHFPDDAIYKPFYQGSSIDQDGYGNSYTSLVMNPSQGSSFVYQSNPMHRILDNFENLVRRFNLVGSREIDRIRSLFGVRPSVTRNQYSTFHGGFSSPLRIQDVTSTSAEPSVDNYLGSYAGKGIVNNNDSFSIESDDFGILIGLSFVQIKPLYCPGLKREVLKVDYLSYYNPEFDHGYSMAVALGELRTQNRTGFNPLQFTQVFGYQQAYDEYRHDVSRVNGDFYDSDLSAFSFARFSPGTTAQTNDVIYQRGPQEIYNGDPIGPYNEFQRIFVDGSGRDHFYLYYSFDIDALRPVRTSSECFDLGVGDVSTSNNPVI